MTTRAAPLVGPIYEETLHRAESFPVEPFNTASNLVFLLLVVFWANRVYRGPERQRLLSWALPVLFIGFVGGTMYHGTRGWPVWLLMDWLPIALLLLAVGMYFMRKVGMGWGPAMALTASPFVAFGLLRALGVPQDYRIAVAYPLLTLPLLLPLASYLRRSAWRDVASVLLAVALFALAVLFRSIDRGLGASLLPGVGTHRGGVPRAVPPESFAQRTTTSASWRLTSLTTSLTAISIRTRLWSRRKGSSEANTTGPADCATLTRTTPSSC